MAREIKNILINYIFEKALSEYAGKFCKGRLVDIGCGVKPYSQLLKAYVDEHVGVDHTNSSHNPLNVDIFGTAYNIPSDDEIFDSAICTAVLEHLEEPEQAIRECYRVLKSGCYAIYSVPFIWHLHEEPRDFFRYSAYGLKYLFEKTGFDIVEIKALSGFWVTFGQLFVYNVYRLNRGPLKLLPIIPLLGLLIQGLSYILDRLDKTEQWTWMYMIVARKPLVES